MRISTIIPTISMIVLFACVFLGNGYLSFVHAEVNDFLIIPKSEQSIEGSIDRVSSAGGRVWDEYNEEAYTIGGSNTNRHKLGMQMHSGIMTWDTLIDYIVYGLRLMSQLGLLIGSMMFIYSGYRYASYALSYGDSKPSSDIVKDAIYGILVIVFSFAIMRILTSAFLT